MGARADLHTILKSILGSDHVYFQPPANIALVYPCIIYKRDANRSMFAGNKPYRNTKRYQITVVDRNPDSELPDKVAELPLCSRERFYTADNLNHDVFNIFF